ncbi:MAG: zinc-binding dehydrogenase [Thermoanaerobaculales bacterium]|nr:zinc-binding dehydrogenase [Thermoanaerobaculales bacterium]
MKALIYRKFGDPSVLEWVETNQLRPHVDEVYPVARAHEAHRHIEGKHTTGKIVLRF